MPSALKAIKLVMYCVFYHASMSLSEADDEVSVGTIECFIVCILFYSAQLQH